MRHLATILVLIPYLLQGQVPIGSWVDHLSYHTAHSVAYNGEEVFCGTASGMFSYNILDNSISRYSTINLLSDVALQKLAVNPYNNTLCVFYKDGNIDLIEKGNKTNLAFIKNSHVILDKHISQISFYKEFAFLTYSFGIVKINTAKKEISETYDLSLLDNNIQVHASVVHNDAIFAATSSGIYKGDMHLNLLNQSNWILQTNTPSVSYKTLFTLADTLYSVSANNQLRKSLGNSWLTLPIDLSDVQSIHSASDELQCIFKDSIVIFDSLIHKKTFIQGNFQDVSDIQRVGAARYFVAEKDIGLREYTNSHYVKTIKPNGPVDAQNYAMSAYDGKLWAVKGGMSNYWQNSLNYGELRFYNGNSWSYYNPWSSPLYLKAIDLIDIAPDPTNPNKIYIASWGGGLLELTNNIPTVLYNDSNSTLVPRAESASYIGIGGIDFDKEGNLWVANSYSPTPLSVKKTDNTWRRFDFSGYSEYTTTIGDVVVSNSDHKWLLLPRSNEILIFDDNGTIDNTSDDRILKLNTNPSTGNIPGSVGITLTFDKNGDAWAGNNQGVFVFYNADNIFSNYQAGAQRIIIDGGENYEILLGTISVTDIKIDGANRKWIATDGSGVYLISADGKEEIHHFTSQNSPLFSDVVNTIAIDHQTGLVYMSTDKGLISYRSNATEGQKNLSQVNIFPNPVRPEYSGPITISGLMEKTTIKITDISGAIVNEITSFGGQATWDGKDLHGRRAATGVYLLFAHAWNDKDNLQTQVGKILFIK